MPCYYPVTGWFSRKKNKSGKRSIVFNVNDGFPDKKIQLPCGRCIGCRLERSRVWATRCLHEASMHDRNCFITLTYAPEHLPSDKSLHVDHFQKFMKRLRRKFICQNVTKPDRKKRTRVCCSGLHKRVPFIRYFQCGEYGEDLQRPHYHACLFGFDFPDKKLWAVREGVRLYRSAMLEDLWPFGFSTIGDVNWNSAAYCARYIMKKISGKEAPDHYKDLHPEYVTMSRRPGIGASWAHKYAGSDVYKSGDFVLIKNGLKCRPPKFYDRIYEEKTKEPVIRTLMSVDESTGRLRKYVDKFSKTMHSIQAKRVQRAKASPDNSCSRLAVREKVKMASLKQLKRSL